MTTVDNLLDRLPVATIIHLLVTIILGIDLLLDGNLSGDALTYAAIVEGGNGLVGIGRAGLKAAKVNADAVNYAVDRTAQPPLN